MLIVNIYEEHLWQHVVELFNELQNVVIMT